jgi:hypothetical protein
LQQHIEQFAVARFGGVAGEALQGFVAEFFVDHLLSFF